MQVGGISAAEMLAATIGVGFARLRPGLLLRLGLVAAVDAADQRAPAAHGADNFSNRHGKSSCQ
jgi:hypothetical protein